MVILTVLNNQKNTEGLQYYKYQEIKIAPDE